MHKKAQVAMEFIIFVSVAVIIVIVYLAIGADLINDASETQRVAALNDVGYKIQDELLIAATVSDGYSRTIIIPAKADRFPYSISNTASAVTLASGSAAITYDIPTISGTLVQGSNIITKGATIAVVPG